METTAAPRLVQIDPPSFREAWEMVAVQLRMEMSRANYDAWIQPLHALSFSEGVFRVGAANAYARDWVQSRLRSRITRLLEGIYNQPVAVQFVLASGSGPTAAAPREAPSAKYGAGAQGAEAQDSGAHGAGAQGAGDSDPAGAASSSGPTAQGSPAPAAEAPGGAAGTPPGAEPAPRAGGKPRGPARNGAPDAPKTPGGSAPEPASASASALPPGEMLSRKVQLQRAYGTERARVIQPERGMFLTMYFFNQWLPLLSHSAMSIIIAARSLCYWNPMTGELRNVVETDMSELARRASVSVRTVKDVLNHELVRRYFLRYRVRRMITPNGVRTAGILLQVRMDDPLTPEDQSAHHLTEEEHWYTADFDDEQD